MKNYKSGNLLAKSPIIIIMNYIILLYKYMLDT